MNGSAETTHIGHLDGVFDCQACDTCPVNIISMAYVEDIYTVTYVQGECIIVHIEDCDVSFEGRDKMYVADFLDWIVDDKSRVNQLDTGLSYMTAEEREGLYTRKELQRTLEAGEFLCTMGYPTEKEAVNMVHDRNVLNITYLIVLTTYEISATYMDLK